MASGAAKTGGAVVVMLIAFIAYIIFKKLQLAQALGFSLKKFDIGGNFLLPEIYITVTVTNPSMNSAELQSVNGNIFVDSNTKIASVNSFTTTSITALSSVDITLKVDPVISDLLTAIKNFLSNPGTVVSFIGSVKVDGISFPVQSSLSLQQLQLNG